MCEAHAKKDVHELGNEDLKMNNCVETMSVEVGEKNLKPEEYLADIKIDNNTKDYDTLVREKSPVCEAKKNAMLLGITFCRYPG